MTRPGYDEMDSPNPDRPEGTWEQYADEQRRALEEMGFTDEWVRMAEKQLEQWKGENDQ